MESQIFFWCLLYYALFLFVGFVLECLAVTKSIKGLEKALDVYLSNRDICSFIKLNHFKRYCPEEFQECW